MEQGWNKLGHTRGDVLEPSPGSGMAIGGRHKHSEWLKRAKNGHFVAIRGSGGSKLVEQCGTRLEQVRAHPGGCDETISQVWKGHWGRHRPSKWLEKAKNGNFLAIGGPGGSKLVDQCGSKLDLVRAHPGQTDGTIPWVRNGH